MRRLLALVLLPFLVAGCSHTAPEPTSPEASGAPHALVLISIDGFRYDYLDRTDAEMPALDALEASGVRAERLVAAFPTKTFPNHYSLVTGLYPEAHGIVGNTMMDPDMTDASGEPARFSLSNREAVTDSRWWLGEPIWVTAEKQGVRAATAFWPGSEAEIGGVRPSDWLVYDGDLSYTARVDTALAWLSRTGEDHPELVTLYFEGVDTQGHRNGPDAPETAEAIEEVDAALAQLVAGLRQRQLLASTDIVIVSDHGMAAVSPERRVILDDAIDLDAETDEVMYGEPVGIWPAAGADVDDMVARIDALDHVQAYRREDTPERLHYRASGRIPPIVLIADEGWTVTSQSFVDQYPDRPTGGTHGFDNRFPSMHGVFVASGPSFREHATTGPLATVDVYDILARVLDVTPAPNSGDPAAADRVLR